MVKENPNIIMIALQKFDAYNAFGQSMSTEQQMTVSQNLPKLGEFFRSDAGRTCITNMANEFVRFAAGMP